MKDNYSGTISVFFPEDFYPPPTPTRRERLRRWRYVWEDRLSRAWDALKGYDRDY